MIIRKTCKRCNGSGVIDEWVPDPWAWPRPTWSPYWPHPWDYSAEPYWSQPVIMCSEEPVSFAKTKSR